MGQELGLREQYQVKQAFYAEVRLNYWLMYEVTSVSRRRKEKKHYWNLGLSFIEKEDIF